MTGVFRNAVVYKGRNRDTAWFSITDQEWNALSKKYEEWLSDDNFEVTSEGSRTQKIALSTMTKPLLKEPILLESLLSEGSLSVLNDDGAS